MRRCSASVTALLGVLLMKSRSGTGESVSHRTHTDASTVTHYHAHHLTLVLWCKVYSLADLQIFLSNSYLYMEYRIGKLCYTGPSLYEGLVRTYVAMLGISQSRRLLRHLMSNTTCAAWVILTLLLAHGTERVTRPAWIPSLILRQSATWPKNITWSFAFTSRLSSESWFYRRRW